MGDKVIKFRVWETKEERMLKVKTLQYINDTHYNIVAIDDNNIEIYLENYPSALLMQYVGVKDMNGKEIYENDVVEFIIDDNKYTSSITYRKDKGFVFGYGKTVNHLTTERLCTKVIGNDYTDWEKINNE